jgi:hypothetical protein
MIDRVVVVALLAVLAASPVLVEAQEGRTQEEERSPEAAPEAETETHVFTVSTFHLPFAMMDEFFAYVEEYNLPIERENPHLLDFKYLVHSWGSTDQTVWLINEYADMGEFQKAEEWGQERFRAAHPDSTEREAIIREFQEKFGEYYDHHTDNLLAGQVRHTKQGAPRASSPGSH